MPIGEEAVAS